MSKVDIAILGSMGSGKSSVSKALAGKLGFNLYEEAFKGNPFLEKYYNSPKEHAFANQMWFLNAKASQHHIIARDPNSTVQDSPMLSCLVFMNAQYDLGLLDKHEFMLLRDVYDFMSSAIKQPEYLVYLEADVDVILDRVKERGREIESKVNEDYIKTGVHALDTLMYGRGIWVDGNLSINDIVDEIILKCKL